MTVQSLLGRFALVAAGFSLATMLSGCSSSASLLDRPPPETVSETNEVRDPRIPSRVYSATNQERLKALWGKRSSQALPSDYPIGPGDVIEISVPGVDDLKDNTVRVSGTGQIELPMLGTIQTDGITEAGLREKIKQALMKYMYDPQVDVFVKEYRSRQVAVVGSVRSAGLITLSGSGESILDAITQAGGMTPDAADEVVLLPPVEGVRARLKELAAAFENESRLGEPPADVAKPSSDNPQAVGSKAPPQVGLTLASLENTIANGPAVVIPIRGSSFSGNEHYINMPAEPGDIIIVPGGGNVMVTGWVQRPGYFQVGSGLTVLGAVGSAGGTMYAGLPTHASLMRSNSKGNKVAITVDLTKIASGEAPDIPVVANDVIDVPYSDLRIGPYIVYSILTRMALPVPAY
jgi:protein involved in polysaccharide export with SLBB domain